MRHIKRPVVVIGLAKVLLAGLIAFVFAGAVAANATTFDFVFDNVGLPTSPPPCHLLLAAVRSRLPTTQATERSR